MLPQNVKSRLTGHLNRPINYLMGIKAAILASALEKNLIKVRLISNLLFGHLHFATLHKIFVCFHHYFFSYFSYTVESKSEEKEKVTTLVIVNSRGI